MECGATLHPGVNTTFTITFGRSEHIFGFKSLLSLSFNTVNIQKKKESRNLRKVESITDNKTANNYMGVTAY